MSKTSNTTKSNETHVNHLDISFRCCILLAILAVENCPPVLVQLDAGDDDLGWVDTNGDSGTV